MGVPAISGDRPRPPHSRGSGRESTRGSTSPAHSILRPYHHDGHDRNNDSRNDGQPDIALYSISPVELRGRHQSQASHPRSIESHLQGTHGEEIAPIGRQRSIHKPDAHSMSMAASYILPASAMSHGHHGHGHSHSHSPGRSHSSNASRSLRQERPRGTLHAYSYSEALSDYNQSADGHEQDAAPHFQKQPYTAGPSGLSAEHIPSPIEPYDPPRIETDLPSHNHAHHDHNDHDHDHHHHHHRHHHEHSPIDVVSVQPRSRFTNLILPWVLRWPLLHTIMADKDSRRIFYFMR